MIIAQAVLPLIGGIFVGLAAMLSATVTAFAARATRIAKNASDKASAVDLAVKSLKEALERADQENMKLRTDLAQAKEDILASQADVLHLNNLIKDLILAHGQEVTRLTLRIQSLERDTDGT